MARRRRKVLGIPVGPKSRSSFPLANLGRLGSVGATAMAVMPVAQRGLKAVGRGQAADLLGAVGKLAKEAGGDRSTTPKLAHLIEEHTDISVPRSVAYNQWTEMEIFPSIAKGVEAVDQLREDRTEWISKIGPVKRRWKAKIVDQVPDERIAWRSESGPEHRGVVTFHSVGEDLTRVLVQMHYVPHGPLETVANKLRIQRRRVRRDLRLFKHFLELRGEETGAWRGRIGSQDGHSRTGPNRATRSGRPGANDGRRGTGPARDNRRREATK